MKLVPSCLPFLVKNTSSPCTPHPCKMTSQPRTPHLQGTEAALMVPGSPCLMVPEHGWAGTTMSPGEAHASLVSGTAKPGPCRCIRLGHYRHVWQMWRESGVWHDGTCSVSQAWSESGPMETSECSPPEYTSPVNTANPKVRGSHPGCRVSG